MRERDQAYGGGRVGHGPAQIVARERRRRPGRSPKIAVGFPSPNRFSAYTIGLRPGTITPGVTLSGVFRIAPIRPKSTRVTGRCPPARRDGLIHVAADHRHHAADIAPDIVKLRPRSG